MKLTKITRFWVFFMRKTPYLGLLTAILSVCCPLPSPRLLRDLPWDLHYDRPRNEAGGGGGGGKARFHRLIKRVYTTITRSIDFLYKLRSLLGALSRKNSWFAYINLVWFFSDECFLPGGGGTQLWVTRHVPPKRPYFFLLAFTKRPHFYQLSPNDPLFFENFDISVTNVEKFLAILALKAPIFDAFHWKTLFLRALSLKDPLFWRNLSPKDPYIWGAWWHSYVTFICECPPRGFLQHI